MEGRFVVSVQDLTSDHAIRPLATRTQHAIRLLAILAECGERTTEGDPSGTARVIRAELKVQALDFWLRNPDYLAEQLVMKVEAGDLPSSFLATARDLLESPEPDLRWYPMPKWHFGAYEALDDAFSLLETYGLTKLGKLGGVTKTVRSQFFLTDAGVEAAAVLAQEPRLSWYIEQAKLVRVVAGDDNGSRLKQRQYEQAEYAGTELGLHIGPIKPQVQKRLAALISSKNHDGGNA